MRMNHGSRLFTMLNLWASVKAKRCKPATRA